jgi:hypothetical protein
MARRVFFSFYYSNDVQRSQVVKKSQFLKDKELAGFFDSSAMEEAKRKDPDSLRRFLKKQMEGSSVVCVLIGEHTANRRWVRFEILQGLFDERGVTGVQVHTIAGFDQRPSRPGPNPFDLLGVYCKDRRVYVVERKTVTDQWTYTTDFEKSVLPTWKYTPNLPPDGTTPLSKYFTVHQWADDGHNNIGDWVEKAAIQARR